MVSGILLGLSIIMSSVYFVNKMFVNDTKDVLVRFIILVFTSLVALFVVDKVIAFKIKLLADSDLWVYDIDYYENNDLKEGLFYITKKNINKVKL